MNEEYFYTDGYNKFGPFTLLELKNKAISRQTKVWRKGLDNWIPLEQVPELKEFSSSLPPGVQQAESNTQVAPKTWLVEAILATIFCCVPFGIVGIVYAAKVDSRFSIGDYQGAVNASNNAKKWVKYSVIAAFIVVVGYFLLFLFGVGSTLLLEDF